LKILQIIFGAIGVVVLVCIIGLVIAGAALPSAQNFANEIEIHAPAEKVWAVINDRKSYPEWQDQLSRVEIVDEKNWLEYLKNSSEPLRFTLARDERPSKMEFHYTMGDQFAGHWSGEVIETPDGVRLKTDDSYATEGVIMKLMVYAFFDADAFAKEWNSKLKARVESLN
jgi:uncharacterized membrane protein